MICGGDFAIAGVVEGAAIHYIQRQRKAHQSAVSAEQRL